MRFSLDDIEDIEVKHDVKLKIFLKSGKTIETRKSEMTPEEQKAVVAYFLR
jgi:hypothetical protein